MKIDVIFKFGGSAVTVKDQLETLKEKELLHACALVKICLEHGKNVVVVHGAGSFGHHQAKQYNVNTGFTHLSDEDNTTVKHGFCKTRISVTKLNHVIVERLCQNEVPAVGIPAFGSWYTDDREIVKHGTDMVIDVLNQGFVPVLHGDCIFDQTKGCVVLSGDIIIKTLCKFTEVRRVVFLTDVDGIYDKAPNNADARLIPNIAVNKDGSFSIDISTTEDSKFDVTDARLIPNIAVNKDVSFSIDISTTEDSKFDVTGGINLKLNTAKNIVIDSNGKILVYICNVTSKPADVLQEDSTFKGTVVQLKQRT